MPVSIVSNLASKFAQQAIRQRNDNMTLGTQRLSSGRRVFTASEDPAAVAVANSLRVENAALVNAQINAAGGVSTLQIADGALGQISDIVIRLKTLAIQAGSGNIGDAERQALDIEFQALKGEIDRIASDTEFNGVPILAGRPDFTLVEAHDAGNDGVVRLGFENSFLSADATFRYSYDSATEQLTLTRIDQGAPTSQTVDITGLLDNLAGSGQNLVGGQVLDVNFQILGGTLRLGAAFDRTADILNVVTDSSGPDIAFAATFPTYTPGGSNITAAGVRAVAALGAGNYSAVTGDLTLGLTASGAGGSVVLDGIPGIRYSVNGGPLGADGVATADLVGDAAGLGIGVAATVDVYVTTTGAPELIGTLNLGVVPDPTGNTPGTLVVPFGQGIIAGEYQDNNGDTTLTYVVGSGVVAGQDLLSVNIPAASTDALGLTGTSITSVLNANLAIDSLDTVLNNISQARAQVGAQQSRLEFVARNLTVATENNEAARSALIDANVPEEITNVTNDRAMLEVGVFMLSQANRLPQLLLQILRQ